MCFEHSCWCSPGHLDPKWPWALAVVLSKGVSAPFSGLLACSCTQCFSSLLSLSTTTQPPCDSLACGWVCFDGIVDVTYGGCDLMSMSLTFWLFHGPLARVMRLTPSVLW